MQDCMTYIFIIKRELLNNIKIFLINIPIFFSQKTNKYFICFFAPYFYKFLINFQNFSKYSLFNCLRFSIDSIK